MAIGISSMHLESLLPQGGERYVRYRYKDIPPRIIAHYNLDALAHDGCVYAETGKAWCGLKEAGRLARGGLRGLLRKHGYRKAGAIGCCIRKARGISFTLVAGGFGAKHKGKAGAGHLASTLR